MPSSTNRSDDEGAVVPWTRSTDVPDGEADTEPRDVPPPRPIPRPRRPRRSRPRADAVPPIEPPHPADPSAEPTAGGPGDADEPPWVRERREEAEFRAQFGDWQAGRMPRRTGPRPGPALLVVAVALLLIAYLVLV